MEKRKKEFVLLAVAVAAFVAFAGIQKKQVKQYTQVLGRNVENTAVTASAGAVCEEKKPVYPHNLKQYIKTILLILEYTTIGIAVRFLMQYLLLWLLYILSSANLI